MASDSNLANENEPEPGIDFKSIVLFVVVCAITFGLFLMRSESSGVGIEIVFVLAASVLISLVIWQACDPFADAAQWVGCKMKLPSSVRGATLDAVASSMPELFTGLFFVTIALTSDKSALERIQESAEGYGSTIATCAGSSIYNMILIPAACAIVISVYRKSRPAIDVARDVLFREGGWVLFTQFALLVFLFQPKMHWWMGVAFLVAYLVYVGHLYVDTLRFRKGLKDGEIEQDEPCESTQFFFGFGNANLNGVSATIVLLVSTAVAAAACYFLVKLTRESADILGVPEFFIAVILTAAVSSIPDTFVSIGSARRGDDSGAMSNVFGSNIFDICIGMSIPLLVGCYLNDWQPIELVDANNEPMTGVVGLRILLFVLTLVAMFVMFRYRKITRKTGFFFCGLYALFFGYAILGALGVLTV